MKIECPSCHVSGNIDESQIPVSGKLVVCPKCGFGFSVKPPPKKWSRFMMNTCPSCGFSTFSEDTFAVCPKCGLDGEKYQKERQAKEKLEKEKLYNTEAIELPPATPPPSSKYVVNHAETEIEESQSKVPQLIQYTGWSISGVGFISAFYGISGFFDYLGSDWKQKILDETGETLGAFSIFLSYGAIPSLLLLYGVFAVYAGLVFLKMTDYGRKAAEAAAWILMAILVSKEIMDVVEWMRLSSSKAGFMYYFAGTLGGVVMTAVWAGLIYLFIMLLRSEKMDDAFDEGEGRR